MRKSLVLALVLVFAIAGATFAATPKISGTFEATAEFDETHEEARLFGPYAMDASLELGISFSEEHDNWDATINVVRLEKEPGLGFYRVNVNEDAFTATVWGKHARSNQSIGHKNDPLVFLRASGNNMALEPKFRVTTSLAGVDVFTQLEGESVYVFGDLDFDGITLGAGLKNKLATAPDAKNSENTMVVYGGADLDVVNLSASYASLSKEAEPNLEDNTALGVKATANVIDPLELEATYKTVGENYPGESGYNLKATYTEGLLQGTVKYDANTDGEEAVTTMTFSAVYRGSEDNLAFDDLFDDYFENVAPAFSASYTMDKTEGKPDTTLEVKATAPLMPGQLWVNGSFTTKSAKDPFEVDTDLSKAFLGYHESQFVDDNETKNWKRTDLAGAKSETTIKVSAYAPIGDKVTLEPSVTQTSWQEYVGVVTYTQPVDNNPQTESRLVGGSASAFTLALDVTYAVADGVELTFGVGQTAFEVESHDAVTNRYTKAGLTVKF